MREACACLRRPRSLPAAHARLRDPLPIDEVLPALAGALREGTRAVLVAPPGAGRRRVPLALLDEPFAREGRIVVLEPRRLAARAAAQRMAASLSERVGETVGLRVGCRACLGQDRIEVVTEGVFARQIVDDPD